MIALRDDFSMNETEVTRELLHAYLDEALSESMMADVEKALRENPELQKRLTSVMQERDRGEHSLGGIWRRDRLTCPSRQLLADSLYGVLSDEEQDYVRFHLEEVQCPYCLANFVDLQSMQQAPSPDGEMRRVRIYKSSAGFLNQARKGE